MTRTHALLGAFAAIALSGSGCCTAKLLAAWDGDGAYDPHCQPASLHVAEDGPDGLWLTLRYADLSVRSVHVPPAQRQDVLPLGRFVSRGDVTPAAYGATPGGWRLEGREVWQQQASGRWAPVALLPTLNDPLGRGPRPPSAAQRIALAALFPGAVLVDGVILGAAAVTSPFTLPFWIGS